MIESNDENIADRLKNILEARSAKVCVVGLGYVGLPMALAFSEVGFTVCGFDVDPCRAEK